MTKSTTLPVHGSIQRASTLPQEEDHLYSCMPGSRTFVDWLRRHSKEIKLEWMKRLSVLSPSYRETTDKELSGTVSRAFQANLEYISLCSFSKIKNFIDYITRKRLKEGFPLSDVQKAFELFRVVVIKRLAQEEKFVLLAESAESINSCLSFTVHRFSDHYQHMHELSILEHTKKLEQAIRTRTAELEHSEKRYKALVEEINDGYFIIQSKRIIFANLAFCRMHRVHPKMVIGRLFSDFVSPESLPALLESYIEIIEGGPGSGPVQYRIIGVNDESGYREVRARLANLGTGPVLIGICRDISDRVHMENQVREHERLAYLGRLSASLSHELRNPLSSIKMNLQILERKLELDGYDRRRLEISVSEVSRLEDILRQLLDTARPLSVTKKEEDLTLIARKCVELLEPKAMEKQLTVIQSFSKKTPRLNLDSSKIQQAIINLLLNAIEASPFKERISIWTRVSRGKAPKLIELGVSDNGPGIPSQQVSVLFTQFNTSKTLGSGLGLSNVKRIIEAHSGTVVFRKPKGPGATFVLKFPLPDSENISQSVS